jgi:hypothetical protein
MTTTSPRISADLEGMMRLLRKSTRPLAPVFEAITNGLEAIVDRQKAGALEPGRITVRFFYTGLIPDESKTLERIEISDNGIGFDDENYKRFGAFLDRSKGHNNRGSGRAQFLHFAEKTEVTSYYHKDGKVFKRNFTCKPQKFIDEPVIDEQANLIESIGSTIAMSNLRYDEETRRFFDSLTLADFRGALQRQYLLRMYLAKCKNAALVPSFTIEFHINKDQQVIGSLTAQDISTPDVGEIAVPFVKIRDPKADDIEWVPQRQRVERLHWAHFKLNESDLPENGVLLCSKQIAVQALRFTALKKADVVDGFRYLTAIYGDALDDADNVTNDVDRFTLPTRADVEKTVHELWFDPTREYLFFDDIKQAVEDALPHIYTDLYQRKESQTKNIEAIARENGIPLDIAHSAKIGLTDTNKQIIDKIYKKHAEVLAEQNTKIKIVFDSLDQLVPTSENYQADLQRKSEELLRLIPEQNKQELSRYVIRREMVAKVLKLILEQKIVAPTTRPKKKSSAKKPREDREGLIHDLLIKRRTASVSGPNDLWVLSEEFVHFEACSEVEIERIVDSKGNKLLRPIPDAIKSQYKLKPDRRPDIFVHVDDSQCILVELKAPDVDLSEYLHQLPRYCSIIGNFSVKPLTKFYCYLIGEEFAESDILYDFRPTVHGDYVRRHDVTIMSCEEGHQNKELGSAHMEIIKLSSLYERARRRNRSFAERLGIII